MSDRGQSLSSDCRHQAVEALEVSGEHCVIIVDIRREIHTRS
jgi:hypothetical protein